MLYVELPKRVVTDLEAPLDLNQLRSFDQGESVPSLQHLLRKKNVLDVAWNLEKASGLLHQE